MTCDDIKILLSELVDGEISAADRAKVEEHLASCADCRAELAALQRLTGMVRELPRETPPRDISAEVVAHIKRSQLKAVKSATSVSRWYKVGGLVAAAAAVVLVLNVAINVDTPEPFRQSSLPTAPAAAKKVEVAKGDTDGVYEEKLKEANKLEKEIAPLAEREKDADMVARAEKKKEVADSVAPALAPSPAIAPSAPGEAADAEAEAEYAYADAQVDMSIELAVADLKSGVEQIREVAMQNQGRIIEAEGGRLVVEVPENQVENFGAQLAKASNIAVQNSVFSNKYGGFRNQEAQQAQQQSQQAQQQSQQAGQPRRQQLKAAEEQADKAEAVGGERMRGGIAPADELNKSNETGAQNAIQRGQAFRNQQQMNMQAAAKEALKQANRNYYDRAEGNAMTAPALKAAPQGAQEKRTNNDEKKEYDSSVKVDEKEVENFYNQNKGQLYQSSISAVREQVITKEAEELAKRFPDLKNVIYRYDIKIMTDEQAMRVSKFLGVLKNEEHQAELEAKVICRNYIAIRTQIKNSIDIDKIDGLKKKENIAAKESIDAISKVVQREKANEEILRVLLASMNLVKNSYIYIELNVQQQK